VKKILISTGGTGGHVIPGEIISEHLNDSFEIYFSTDQRGLKYLSVNKNKTIIIDTPKLNLSFFLPFRLIKLFFLILKSLVYLKKEKINKVFSTGGYMSIPVIISARILRLKIYLLEPNLMLGRSNSFFLNFSKKIICYSDKIVNFPKKFINKIELINPLVSKAFYEIKKNEDVNKKFHILISGGSQGANFFNEIIKEVIVDLAKKYPLKIIQQTNIQNIKKLEDFYNSNNIENEIFNFEKNFINLINKSDLCITRSGATSLAEISIMNKPFVAIPLPTSKDDHQMENAKFYENKGCCWVLNQKLLNKEKLLDVLSKILDNKSDFNSKKSNLIKLNNKNSWNDVNQKLKKIINEN
jgi:UDP-N-acetylglucosamine--N-acetylmuramyl-(pentapeptide) pyrophosphoryl-undecaprenol N-acetylglucosamine transferase